MNDNLAENATSHFWQSQDSDFFQGSATKNVRDPYVSTRKSPLFAALLLAHFGPNQSTRSNGVTHKGPPQVSKRPEKNVSNSIQACKDGAIQYAKRDDVRLYDTVVQMYIYICISYIDIYIYIWLI